MVSLRGHRNGEKTRRSSVGKSLKRADWSIHSKLNMNSSCGGEHQSSCSTSECRKKFCIDGRETQRGMHDQRKVG